MAEAAGLVIGTVSLAGLFTNCVDCFNYVRVGQALEDDFPVYQTELDVLQLRFSRWAQAVTVLSTAKSPSITDDVAPLVERILRQIAKLFQRAREDAEDYADHGVSTTNTLDPLQVPKVRKIHLRLKAVIERRQKTTKTVGSSDRAQWALFKKDEFVTLIINIRTKVDDLEKLIAATELKDKLAQMRLEDATEIKSESMEEAKLMDDCTKDVDPAWGVAVEQLRTGNRYSNTDIGDYSEVQMGDTTAQGYTGPLSQAYNSYYGTRIGKHAKVSMGNIHGKTVFDKT